MKVEIIRHTLSPEELVALGARLCYSRARVDDLLERVSSRDQTDFVNRIMNMGHESVLEHASFTFGVEGVSRVLLAQITRHRLASFSVQSQRYTGANPDLVIPDSMCRAELVDDIIKARRAVEHLYVKAVRLGVPEEDARYLTFQAGETRMMVTMNVRELRHFFSLRCCNRAQWEIRALADEMLRLCKEVAPMLFADAGPGCVRGKCPEGDKCCGKPKKAAEMRENA
jgi:thymidylate synthase (FAD)